MNMSSNFTHFTLCQYSNIHCGFICIRENVRLISGPVVSFRRSREGRGQLAS